MLAAQTSAAPKTYRCFVEIVDGRCPGCCCGAVIVYITSPTGRTVSCPAFNLDATTTAKLQPMVRLDGRRYRNTTAHIALTGAEMAQAAKYDGDRE